MANVIPFYEWAIVNQADTIFQSAENYADFLSEITYQEVKQGGTFIWYSTFGDLWNGPDGQRLYYYCGNSYDLLSPSEAGGADKRSYDVSPWAANTTFYAGIPSQTRWNQLKAPWSGTYVITDSIGIDSYYTYNGNTYPIVRRYNTATYSAVKGTTLPFSTPNSYEGRCNTWRGTVYMPVVEVTPNPGEIQFGERAGNIVGTFGIESQSGLLYPAHRGLIVDESAIKVFNPATGDTITAETWVYDYPSRTYTLTTQNGGNVIVTFGDDDVTIDYGANQYTVYYLDIADFGGAIIYRGRSKVIKRLCEEVTSLTAVAAEKVSLFVDEEGYICADYGGD